jgi:hypothetical protein
MKTLWVAIVLVVIMTVVGASPAAAFCYDCRRSGFACGLWGCVESYTCHHYEGFCSICFQSCDDYYDGYCTFGPACQWTSNELDEDPALDSSTTLASVEQTAP